MARPPVAYLAWIQDCSRPAAIAAALGGEAKCFFTPAVRKRHLVPLRYLLSALLMGGWLLRHRPRSLIVTNPPIFAALIGYSYGVLFHSPMLLDSHPVAFGAKDHRDARRVLALHRFLARRARSTMVTSQDWVDVVRSWGGRGVVVHEAPSAIDFSALGALAARPTVLFVGIFAGDEPIQAVVDAAGAVAEADWRVTGDIRRAPAGLVASAPSNVEFVGYLPRDAYRAELASADLVVTLTTEPTSVMRAAYEAVYAGRPLVVSDWPLLRELFQHAVFVKNSADEIAAGARQALAEHDKATAHARTARDAQLARWHVQLAELRALLDL